MGETVGGYSLLYTWPGTDPSLPPVLLMGHMDVVPVEAGTEARWKRPPFAGVVEGGFVWGAACGREWWWTRAA